MKSGIFTKALEATHQKTKLPTLYLRTSISSMQALIVYMRSVPLWSVAKMTECSLLVVIIRDTKSCDDRMLRVRMLYVLFVIEGLV
jgi:hypothetical protein